MKRILLVSLALLTALTVQGQSALSGKRFTEAELLNAFPEGLVKPAPFPVEFNGNDLVYSVGRDRFTWSAKTGVGGDAMAAVCGTQVRSYREILLSGDPKKIAAWQDEQALARTRLLRPELLK